MTFSRSHRYEKVRRLGGLSKVASPDLWREESGQEGPDSGYIIRGVVRGPRRGTAASIRMYSGPRMGPQVT
jgi:hypothetical protein